MKRLLILLSFVFLNSCEVAPDLNRVSGGYIDKSILRGEWYYGSSIVDKQYHDATSFIGSACSSDRIRFELTESMLYAYRSYEKVGGTESSNAGSQNMIAAFKVVKHFDIKRDYNENTGVESNLMVENDFDQPWFKRKYVRIDWAKSLAPDTECNDWFKTQGFIQIQRETHPREPYKVRTSEDYIEATQEALIRPSEEACAAIGEWNCLPSRAKKKMSFRKVKESNYEARDYPDSLAIEYGIKGKEVCFKGEEGCEQLKALWTYSGHSGTEICDPVRHNLDDCTQHTVPVFSKFGYFRTDRYQYDRERGFTLTARKQLINRWNIWKDPAQKIPQPIIYYLNVDFPQELYQASQEIAQDWSSAFADTVASLRKETRQEVEQKFGALFQIRKNSCNIDSVKDYAKKFGFEDYLKSNGINRLDLDNLEEACAVLEWGSMKKNPKQIFRWEQLGDIRYSILNYSRKSGQAGLLGYGPVVTDPLTGEIIQGSVNVYGASIDTYASIGADIVQGLNNKVGISELMQDDLKSDSVKVALNFSRLLKSRTSGFTNSNYFVQLPVQTPSNWELLKDLKLEERYLLKEFQPSRWENKESPLEKKIDFWSKRNGCYVTDMLDPQVADLAEQLKDKSWMEAHQYIRAAVFKGVTAHEIGHTLGLRHNFSGSNDALNFFPEFWKEGTKRRSEYKYASIMDYHQRFNSDFSGIGLYDRAAIKFGYGNLVEVFDESQGEFVPRSWSTNAKLFHYRDLPYLYSGNGFNEKLKSHYEEVKSAYDKGEDSRIDVRLLKDVTPKYENFHKRKDVPFEDYYLSASKKIFGKNKKDALYEVPYMYCSDTYAWGGVLTCNRFDMGASVEEIVDNAAELYNSYYWLNSFRRDRIDISPEAYMGRLYSRTFQPMLNPFKYLYYYQKSSLSIWPLVQDWSAAAYKGLNFFGKILQSVEPGRYCLTAKNMYVPADQVDTCDSPIEIDLEEGRYYDTHFGQNFFYKANNVGYMYDKILAMYALTDSRARFMRDFSDQFNRGALSIGYYRVFAPEMVKVFTNLMLDNKEDNAPYVVTENGRARIKYRPVVSLGQESLETLPKIQPSGSWVLRYYALMLPVLNFSSSVDSQMDYIKRARITLVGSQNDPVHSLKFKQSVFEDPRSKKQYRSVMVDSEELSPGYQILEEANQFAAKASPEIRDKGLYDRLILIDLLRSLGDAFDLGR